MSKTWHYGKPEDGILRVRIEREDRPVNALSRAILEELANLVEHIKSDPSIQGVLFFSGKPGNFIVGADVTELKDLQGSAAALEISQFGQKVFQDLEDLTVPTVALISGACLGGGLEFALACNYRIADEHRKTLLGLPEVKLGLIPGWGGTVRLPRLIGLFDALPLILTGKMLNGYQARSRGLIHDVVPTEALPFVGEKILKTLRMVKKRAVAEAKLFRRRKKPLWKRVLDSNRLGKNFVLNKAEQQTLAKTHGNYPAPIAAIETLRCSLGKSEQEAFASESEAVSHLANSPVTVECMRLFFLQEESKKPPESLDVPIEPDSIRHAAVVGAGAMGAGIALLMAKKGIWTRMKDLKSEFVSNGMKTVRKLLDSDKKRRRLTPVEATRALDHLSPTTEYRGLKNADIVVEAVVEDVDIKRQLFRELAEASNSTAVLATNTSSLLVQDIARDIPHPERVVGLHFFNPPHQMPLVELIKTDQTSPEALATAFALVRRLGKTCVIVGDCAGFLVNRLLSPYMNEAGFLLAEIEDPMEIERAAIEFGMPMGPLELTDLVGIDVAAHVAENMHRAYGDRMAPAPLWKELQQLRAEQVTSSTKLLQGKGKKKQINRTIIRAVSELRKQHGITAASLPRDTIIERLIYAIVNEAARCLEEGIVEHPEQVDLAMVFGTGFAPFRGGPLRYADSIGLDKVVEALNRFAVEHPRLEPSEALRRLTTNGLGFTEPAGQQLSSAVA